MAHMYGGAILFIDLSDGRVSKEMTSSYSGAFLGGRGINIKLLYDGSTPEIEPLNPSSLLIFGMGPLCGSPVSGCRTEVTARSPETEFLGSSSFGGQFGPELKSAGYDHVVISGKADKPVYIWINNEHLEIRDASNLWGKDTYQTQSIIRAVVDTEVQVACIGQAGENLVHFATIQHDLGHGAGRTGMGAVMGSKNLKAIVVRGTKKITLAHPDEYLAIADQLQQEIRNHPSVKDRQQHGMALKEDNTFFGDPPQNFEPVRSYNAVLKYKPTRTGCYGCPQQCMDLYPAEAFGGGVLNCEFYIAPIYPVRNRDTDLMLECGILAQRYGVDIVSIMSIIGFLMKVYEKGLIGAKDTDGVPMEWGSPEAILGMFHKIVRREGFGDLLADGVLPAAAKIGKGSSEYANQAKGLPIAPTHDHYSLSVRKGLSLANAVAHRGDLRANVTAVEGVFDWLHLTYDAETAAKYEETVRQKAKMITGTEEACKSETYEGKPELVVYFEDVYVISDMLGNCRFVASSTGLPFTEQYQAALLSKGTGTETSPDILFQFAKKVRNLERVYDACRGMTRDNDILPKRFFDRRIERGRYKGAVLDRSEFEKMKTQYYTLRGWDPATGIPTRETLVQTGLENVAQDLEK